MKRNENRSLFLYTALIFIVALLLIILSFFGESHMQQNQPKPTTLADIQNSAGNGLTERAAQLSEDNRLLLEQNKSLIAENEEIRAENQTLTEKTETTTQINAYSEKLFDIYGLLYQRNYTAAQAALAEIDPEALNDKQKEFYDILIKKSK